MSEAIDYYALPEQPVRNLTPVPARGLIEISNVSKFFGKHKALDDVSLTLQPGTVTVILGLPAPENRRCCGRSTIWSASTRVYPHRRRLRRLPPQGQPAVRAEGKGHPPAAHQRRLRVPKL